MISLIVAYLACLKTYFVYYHQAPYSICLKTGSFSDIIFRIVVCCAFTILVPGWQVNTLACPVADNIFRFIFLYGNLNYQIFTEIYS